MPEPISMIVLGKLAAVGGKMALKAYFVGKMALLKSFLAAYVGPQVASISVSVLATAAATVYWEKNIKRSTDEKAIEAAVAKGVSRDVARGIIKWMYDN